MIPYKDAFCVPGEQVSRHVTRFGVYDASGALIPGTSIQTSVWQSDPAPSVARIQDSSRLFGPALFAGSVDKQFGFILLNSLGRLPSMETLPIDTTLVYAARRNARATSFSILPNILRSLGILNPIIVTESPLAFETLYTGEEWFRGLEGTGKPEFYDWLDTRWRRTSRADPERKIYVTRSGLGPSAGRYACEDHLEHLLVDEGYEIFSPEAHSISEQVRTFQQAGKLIFAEGTALHLFSLLRQPDQISAVIHRRETLPKVMLTQMADRAGPPTLAINTVKEIWWAPLRGDHLSRSVLDFQALGSALTEAGLIRGSNWTAPSDEAVAASLRAGLKDGEDVMTTEERAKWLQLRKMLNHKKKLKRKRGEIE